MSKRTFEYGGESYVAEIKLDSFKVVQALALRALKSKTGKATALRGGVTVTVLPGSPA